MNFHTILQLWVFRNYYEGFIFSENLNDNCVDDDDHLLFQKFDVF